jgi:hypothetical protein
MEIPLDLERRLERRWVARFFRAKHIALKARINLMPRRANGKYPPGRPLARNGDESFGQVKKAEVLLSGSISNFAEERLGEIREAS